MEAGAQQIALLREQRPQRGAGIFQTAIVDADRERHLARLGRHAEAGEELREIRVVALIVDLEAGIDRQIPALRGHRDRVGMATGPGRRLVDHDVVALIEQPSGSEARYAGADDRDAHRLARAAGKRGQRDSPVGVVALLRPVYER
jgi:hypothetical protein